MKSFWIQLTLVTVVGVLTYNVFSYAEDAEEWMPDVNLRQAVRETLELTADESLRKDQMQQIVSLYLKDKGISDITGLEFATNITELDISQNPITDLRPLSNLTQLIGLHFWHFPGNSTNLDLRPLASLINLEVTTFEGNGISDITPLAGLKKLRELYLTNNRIEEVHSLAGLINLEILFLEGNGITDISPLSNLKKLRILHLKYNNIQDLSPVSDLNLSEFSYHSICDFSTPGPSITERIQNRDFPSIIGFWSEESPKYDFQYGSFLGLFWNHFLYQGLATHLTGDIQKAKEIRQQLLKDNPNTLFVAEVRVHNQRPSKEASAYFPIDSDFFLKDSSGEILRNNNGEYVMNILNPDLQDLLIERIVGFAKCGIFDGVELDCFLGHGVQCGGAPAGPEEAIIAAYIRILREVRAQVRDDFLIILNGAHTKLRHYAEFINGSAMEYGKDSLGSREETYKRLQLFDEVLTWNEENFREPVVNWAHGPLYPSEPPDSPDNQRSMRLLTARGLTLSDGYVLVGYVANFWQRWLDDTLNYWYPFWDAPLGHPIGEKGKQYDNREDIFIREFTNGWVVYNRSKQAQSIELPMQATGVHSGITSKQHTVPDLDGEIYLKQETGLPADVNGDGVVNIQDLVIVANAFGEAEPDVNGDGVVNIQDLVIVANAF
ncbi:MAG: leucine-rich repeat domain-containing protein [Candidatus Poribacteria bacterium]|nr:leucine-rich repeat domain-containing protein [Candidatus Poribacteria bacterium]